MGKYTLTIYSKHTKYWSRGYTTFDSLSQARKAASTYNKYYGYKGYKARPVKVKKLPKKVIWR